MGGVYSTGPLFREKDDRNRHVKGEVKFMNSNDSEYILIVYNPETDELIHEEVGVATEGLTSLKYKVNDSDDVWVTFLLTNGLSLVNIFHSVDDHHRPSLCLNFTSSLFFLFSGLESSSYKSKIPQLSAKLMPKLSAQISTKINSFKSKIPE